MLHHQSDESSSNAAPEEVTGVDGGTGNESSTATSSRRVQRPNLRPATGRERTGESPKEVIDPSEMSETEIAARKLADVVEKDIVVDKVYGSRIERFSGSC